LGIEDLGVCERAFSRSNALAGTVRYMGVFHRMQAIAQYFEDTDHLETYQNLCRKVLISALPAALTAPSVAMFLWNNYKQALQIIEETPKLIAQAMEDLGISDTGVFEVWLQEEEAYLLGLKKEPAEETLPMEYYQRLVNLWSECVPHTSGICGNILTLFAGLI
jgi:hypothetical protein